MPPKKEKVEAPKLFEEKKHFNHTLVMLVVLILLGYLVTRFEDYLSGYESASYLTFWDVFLAWWAGFWHDWKGIAVVVSILSLIWWLYSFLKLEEIKKEEKKIFNEVKEETLLEQETSSSKPRVNEKWVKVLEHMNSSAPADWRLAIIEADIMLDEALRAKGYPGDGVGEMLKSVGQNDLTTLDAAWEAHKVRNRIAHSGSDFDLNERETKRVIALFESVFKELGMI